MSMTKSLKYNRDDMDDIPRALYMIWKVGVVLAVSPGLGRDFTQKFIGIASAKFVRSIRL